MADPAAGPTKTGLAVTSSSALAAETLRQMIFSGQLRAREFVHEQQLARQLGMSRTPVREAIRDLCTQGLLVRNEKGQASVFAPSAGDLQEIYRIRLLLEPDAVRESVANRSAESTDEIRRQLEVLEGAAPGAEWAAAHAALHRAMIAATAGRRLPELIMSLRLQSDPYARMFISTDPTFREGAAADHRQMAVQAAAGLADEAAETVARHLRRTKSRLDEMVEREIWT
ncbi:GntR family transcriptional regulator [Actinophytocola oryzae]|uniref:GntR family transcriptional regulator n=1 Tax=Actinophytocola oryzae TaxID=502181 RepID=A0A4R7W521_9PSEU|nr:GntR family transcriptional regulator [Actinophytocola oryzae]TDV57840.1 GntR family transcriptional regulator [Actinophytocola oryzae]